MYAYFFVHSCEAGAGQSIDKDDAIQTSGFYIETGAAQVNSLLFFNV